MAAARPAAATARLSLHGQRRRLAYLGTIFGVLLGVLYGRFVVTPGGLHGHEVLAVWILSTIAGGVFGYLIIAVPRAVYLVFRKYYWHIILSSAGDRSLALATEAQHAMTEEEAAEDPTPEQVNDLAVIACLRRHYLQAVDRLLQLPQLSGAAETSNLLVTLAETHRWPQLAELLDPGRGVRLPEANLARVAFLAPEGSALDRLRELTVSSRLPRVLNNLSVRALRAGDLPQAEALLTRALDMRSSFVNARVNLSGVHYREGKIGEALNEMIRASEVAPGEALVCSNLGLLLCETDDLATAEQWLRRAANRAPHSGEVQVNLGNCYALELKLEDALEAYRAAARHEELAALAEYNAALLQIDCGEYEAAQKRLQSAAQRAPQDMDIVNNLGCIMWWQKAYTAAEELFARAAADNPSSTATGNLICAKLTAGRAGEALELLNHADYDALEVAFDKGLAHLLAALALDREAGMTQRKLYDHHLQNALAGFGAVVGEGRGPLAEAYINLALVEYLNEHYEASAKAFSEAAKRFPEIAELNYYAGVSYLLGGMQKQQQRAEPGDDLTLVTLDFFRQARPYLEKAMESAQAGVAEEASYNLGVVSYLTGDYERAIVLLKKAAHPEAPPEVFNAVGIAQARLAQEMYRSLTGNMAASDPKRRQIVGEINKQLSGAIHYFRLVLKAQPHSPLVHANIGLAHMLRNGPEDIEAALHHWTLMRQVGGAWGQRAFELFSQAMNSDEAKRLRFQDIEMSFRPVPAREWIHFTPPRLSPRRYAMQDFPDLPIWTLQAHDPLVRKALRFRDRAERARAELHMLGE